jgi:hypothetical protein
MLLFLHGNNQHALKDYILNLKKRAPLTEEFDARAVSADELFARCFTGMLLPSKTAARLIVIFGFLKSAAAFQNAIIKRITELARLPDVVLFYEEEEIKLRFLDENQANSPLGLSQFLSFGESYLGKIHKYLIQTHSFIGMIQYNTSHASFSITMTDINSKYCNFLL